MHVGIDLGTTYSTVAYFDKVAGKVVVMKNKEGKTVTPSVVGYDEYGKLQYGWEAKELQEFGDGETVSFYKREMGNSAWEVTLNGSAYSAEELSGIFLRGLIEELNESLADKITSAVITVPAYFNDYQREATRRAGQKAGLKVIDIVNESTAAAIAFGVAKAGHNGTYMVYDLGGGTFDVTIVSIKGDTIQTIATDGDHRLGGKDWDDRILEYMTDLFNEEFRCDVLDEIDSPYDLLVRAEKLKKELTDRESAYMSISHNGDKGRYQMTVDQFYDVTEDLMTRTEFLCNNLLESHNMTWDQITGVILVGGSTRMKMVHGFVERMSHKPPIQGENVDEAVAIGAAMQAEMLQNEIEVLSIGGRKEELASIGSRKQEAMQLGGRKMTIQDVIAHALGRVQISADGSRFINDVMIQKDMAIPCSVMKPSLLKAGSCYKGESELYILQGSQVKPLDNTILEKRVISGIEYNDKKDVVIEVTYNYDRGGTVHVEAVQKETGKRLSVRSEMLGDDLSWLNEDPRNLKPRKVFQDVDVILALDTSGSMYSYMEDLRKASINFVNQLDLDVIRVGIIEFESTVHTRLKLTHDENQIMRVLNSLHDGGGTVEPISTAYQLLSGRDCSRYIVVLTDGSWCAESVALEYAERCKHEGIEIMAIGLGSGVNRSFLDKIATTKDNTIMANVSEMGQAFGNVGQVIAKRTAGLTLA